MSKPIARLPPTSEIAAVFAVPLAQAQYPDHVNLNAELRRLFLARSQDPDVQNASPSLKQQEGVFESQFNLFAWPDRHVQALRKFCWTELGRTIQALNGYSAEQMRDIEIHSHTWFHITRRGGFVIAHTHPMASWSGVYCVAPGETPPGNAESGVLRFHNPHFYSNVFLDPGNAHLSPPFHHGTWNVALQPGQLVLFPSWLQHDVLPFYGSDERITVAFNCWFGSKAPQPAGS